MLLQRHAKNQKHIIFQFSMQLKNLIPGPFRGAGVLFIPKLSNKIISPNYQFSCCCNFLQKIRYIDLHGFVIQLNKLVLGSFLSNKPSSIPPPHKKSFKSILSLYAAVTSSNNFSQNLKKPQKPNLDPLQPERPQNKVFPENI